MVDLVRGWIQLNALRMRLCRTDNRPDRDAPDMNCERVLARRKPAQQLCVSGDWGRISGLAVCRLCWLPKNLMSSCQVANSDWPWSFHGTGRGLQYLLRALLEKFMPETSAYCVGLIGQTCTFIDNLRLAVRVSYLSSKC